MTDDGKTTTDPQGSAAHEDEKGPTVRGRVVRDAPAPGAHVQGRVVRDGPDVTEVLPLTTAKDSPEPSLRLVGYQARTGDGSTVIGEIEGVRPHGVRIHKIPGHHGHHGYLPAEAIAHVEDATNTVFLGPGVTLDQVLDAPPPPDQSLEGWHKSNDWWADLLGHYGLFESEGRKSEPYLHPDQK